MTKKQYYDYLSNSYPHFVFLENYYSQMKQRKYIVSSVGERLMKLCEDKKFYKNKNWIEAIQINQTFWNEVQDTDDLLRKYTEETKLEVDKSDGDIHKVWGEYDSIIVRKVFLAFELFNMVRESYLKADPEKVLEEQFALKFGS